MGDGRELKRLTRSPGNDAHAAWSPDGQWIAFASARGGFKDEMPVGEDAFEEATPAFAPPRRRVARRQRRTFAIAAAGRRHSCTAGQLP